MATQNKTLTHLEKRLRQAARQDAEVARALQRAKAADRASRRGGSKRLANEELARYLALPLRSYLAIREEDGFRARAYDPAKQVLALADHLFVRYRPPYFLYRAILSEEGRRLVFQEEPVRGGERAMGIYREWLLAIADGRSFAKLAVGALTKREAHWFLQAPAAHNIETNLIWARARAAGIPSPGADFLVERLAPGVWTFLADRAPDLLRFYAAAWDRMGVYDRNEMTDFVRAMAVDPGFSFKNRTHGSMVKLCQEWHRTVHVGTVGRYISWPVRFGDWEIDHPPFRVQAVELSSNRALLDEGRRQRHCVFTYAQACEQGVSVIVSLRWRGRDGAEAGRLTLEVRLAERTIVQIRGVCNRRPSDEEMPVVRRWAGACGLRIAGSA